MSSLTTTFTTASNPAQGYLATVGNAALTLLGALLAVKPYQELAAKDAGTAIKAVRTSAKFSPRQHARDIAALYAEANRYESSMPNLSAELRCMASRA